MLHLKIVRKKAGTIDAIPRQNARILSFSIQGMIFIFLVFSYKTGTK